MKILAIAVAGAFGTLARYGLQGLVQNSIDSLFPWGTAVVNILGCLAFGVMASIFENYATISGQWRIIILIGFMGGFTTFSSFINDTNSLLVDSQWLWAAGNVAIQNVAGLAALLLGLRLGSLV